MVAKNKLYPEAYERQISGLVHPPAKGKDGKNHAITIKVDEATRDKLKKIDGWPDKLRAAIAEIIKDK
jgi:hypothetical protein